ncbi:hypothetical protein BD779DRAFT_1559709 [Infundibulicybe gibba]|nr:hypothetical protein BD779DRAFT_1559709 [Infundibulicybe gibba]
MCHEIREIQQINSTCKIKHLEAPTQRHGSKIRRFGSHLKDSESPTPCLSLPNPEPPSSYQTP